MRAALVGRHDLPCHHSSSVQMLVIVKPDVQHSAISASEQDCCVLCSFELFS
jgi:hypothetical protein